MKKLFKSYENLKSDFVSEIEELIQDLLNEGTEIKFPELVSLHFITDCTYTSLKWIDKDLILHVDLIESSENIETYEYSLDELDLAGLYELALALAEKRYVVV